MGFCGKSRDPDKGVYEAERPATRRKYLQPASGLILESDTFCEFSGKLLDLKGCSPTIAVSFFLMGFRRSISLLTYIN